MMSSVIRQEMWIFLLSILHGIFLTLLYDLFRSLRRAFPHGIVLISLEDFFFWMAAGFLTFCLIFSGTDGVIRGYVGAGIFLGAFLYHKTASPYVVLVLGKSLQFAAGIVRKAGRLLKKLARKILLENFVVKELNLRRKRGKIKKENNKRGKRGSINESKKKKKTQ
ncbi:MAG TPA: spore cortex biosynthesis protein YabQ [Candidatus Choladousia intestinigallinarum]|nr:spore cortex biosynthesis protein YabQ [Candidatus Choladousia intestinigallinarum]